MGNLGGHTKRITSKHITKHIKTKHINSKHINDKTYQVKNISECKTYQLQNISATAGTYQNCGCFFVLFCR